MISMFSISFGLRSSRREGPEPPTPMPLVVAEFARIPSMMTMGSLLSEKEFCPRMRIREPVPVAPVDMTCTPAARPERSDPMFEIGSCCSCVATAIWVVEFASSTLRWSPVAVVTTALRENTAAPSATSCVADVPVEIVNVMMRGA
jgi:hypothetical protein